MKRQYAFAEALRMAGDPETYDKIEAVHDLVKAAVYPVNLNNSHAMCSVAFVIGNGELFEVCIVEPDTTLHWYSVEGDSVLACVIDTVSAIQKMLDGWK